MKLVPRAGISWSGSQQNRRTGLSKISRFRTSKMENAAHRLCDIRFLGWAKSMLPRMKFAFALTNAVTLIEFVDF
jgi:hypothetical protein